MVRKLRGAPARIKHNCTLLCYLPNPAFLTKTRTGDLVGPDLNGRQGKKYYSCHLGIKESKSYTGKKKL